MAEATIETIKNGPYIVKGEFELRDAEGNVYPVSYTHLTLPTIYSV